MAREGLKLELANGIRKSASQKQSVHYDGLRVKTNGDLVLVNLTIRPISEPPSKRGLLMVVFDEIKAEERQRAEILVAESSKEARSRPDKTTGARTRIDKRVSSDHHRRA